MPPSERLPHDNSKSDGFLFDLNPSIDDYEPSEVIPTDFERESEQDDSPWSSPVRSVATDDRDHYLQLALVNGVGPITLAALMQYFGSAREVLSATLSQLGQVPRVGPKLSTLIRDASQENLCEKVKQHCKQTNTDILLPGDESFPRLLAELPNPPVLLFTRGTFTPADQLSIGIVGTRHCTHYGKTMAERLSKGLAQVGITIVSGLARGIDSIAHRGSLEAGGRTIAVLGSSVSDIYPPEHKQLAEDIIPKGVLVSETHPFAKPKAGVFPQRNRIISGLSIGVIVVEAADRSGSLITARHAGEQGRDLFAVPGQANSRMSRGCNQLIRDGAILIQDVEDVIEHLGPLVEKAKIQEGKVIHHPSELNLNEIEQAVLQAIESAPTDIDQVIVKSKMPVPRVLSTLSVLEMRGLIYRISGRSVARK